MTTQPAIPTNRGASVTHDILHVPAQPTTTGSRRDSRSGETVNVERIINLALDSLSQRTRVEYTRALSDFLAFVQIGGLTLCKATVSAHVADLMQRGVGAVSIRVRLSAIRRFVIECADNGLLDENTAQAIRRVGAPKRRGQPVGRWLMTDEVKQMLALPDRLSIRGKRDYAILALLLGAGLRRAEIPLLTRAHFKVRDNRWVIADLVGKGNRMRTVPIARWVKQAVDAWLTAGVGKENDIHRPIFRRIFVNNKIGTQSLSSESIYQIVRHYNPLPTEQIAPHDMRRTFARQAKAAGADIAQIQFSLGHASSATTERYLGNAQDLTRSPSDLLPFGAEG